MTVKHRVAIQSLLSILLIGSIAGAGRQTAEQTRRQSMREINKIARPEGGKPIALVGATLIDGRGGAPVGDSAVVLRDGLIVAAGKRDSTPVPKDAEVIDVSGLALLPGFIDSHFHIDGDDALPALFLTHGVTSARDPGQWIEAYDAAQRSGAPIPRLFLSGPHLDSPPPAYPADSFIVRDADEARNAVNRFIDQGASVIKVYFRLPLGLIKVVTETAHA